MSLICSQHPSKLVIGSLETLFSRKTKIPKLIKLAYFISTTTTLHILTTHNNQITNKFDENQKIPFFAAKSFSIACNRHSYLTRLIFVCIFSISVCHNYTFSASMIISLLIEPLYINFIQSVTFN